MHALEQELIGIPSEIEDTLHSQDAGARFRQKRSKPPTHPGSVEIAGLDDTDGRNALKVGGGIMGMIVVMVIVVVIARIVVSDLINFLRQVLARRCNIEDRSKIHF